MIRSLRSVLVPMLLTVLFVLPVHAEDKAPVPKDKDKAAKVDTAEKCEEHGVKKTICARCNPKLEPVFRAKNDWCEEHTRPESQCSICHPDLKKKGIK